MPKKNLRGFCAVYVNLSSAEFAHSILSVNRDI